MTNVSKYQMGLKLISISMLHLTSIIDYSMQLLKETTTILVLTDSIEYNTPPSSERGQGSDCDKRRIPFP